MCMLGIHGGKCCASDSRWHQQSSWSPFVNELLDSVFKHPLLFLVSDLRFVFAKGRGNRYSIPHLVHSHNHIYHSWRGSPHNQQAECRDLSVQIKVWGITLEVSTHHPLLCTTLGADRLFPITCKCSYIVLSVMPRSHQPRVSQGVANFGFYIY
jgi:hypothetical protein